MNPCYPNPEPQHPDDAKWMEKAIEQARLAQSCGQMPVGACITMDGSLIATGHNQTTQTNDPCAHAEILALRKACQKIGNYRLPKSVLYVTLEPCLMCLGALLHARVDRMVFGVYDNQWSLTQPPISGNSNHSLKWTPEVLPSTCQALLDDFFAIKRGKT